jgi:hypothetical protein
MACAGPKTKPVGQIPENPQILAKMTQIDTFSCLEIILGPKKEWAMIRVIRGNPGTVVPIVLSKRLYQA